MKILISIAVVMGSRAMLLLLAVGVGVWNLQGQQCFVMADEPAANVSMYEQVVQPFLQQHCVRCHNEDELTSGVRVDHLTADVVDRDIKLWDGIHKQIRSGMMPPADEPQPSAEERESVVTWIGEALNVARSRPTPKNGGARRLTVAQLQNTLRDLLLLEEELTDLLPPDAVSKDGFLNNQETLALSPLLLENYFDIAGKALSRCMVDIETQPTIQNFRMDLGAGINPDPIQEKLILGADSQLLPSADFVVTELEPSKSFAFTPFRMQTKFQYIEGYQGNDTVRGWREFNSIYHAVFACVRGAHGYPKGLAYSLVRDGLLLRPAIPSVEEFGVGNTYGPHANFKVSLRELPDEGRFRVTVVAAKYEDGLLLDPGAEGCAFGVPHAIDCRELSTGPKILTVDQPGVYQVDVYRESDSASADSEAPQELTLSLGDRQFVGKLHQPAFLVVRLPSGELPFEIRYAGKTKLERVLLTPLAADHPVAERFLQFESRAPSLGVHLGLRRDCGSTLSQVGNPQIVATTEPARFIFEGAIRNFPSPDVERDNVNYLAGVREIGVRSEYTDGREMPRLLIRSVEFEGPYLDAWPPASHRNLFIDSSHRNDAIVYAGEIIRSFGARAFRRPLEAAEETELMEVYVNAIEGGSSFQAGIKDALQVVLTMPQFLFLVEDSQSPAGEPLNDFELASKLSYFLWNSPPDDETLALAAKGQLGQHLDAEVERLIADPRFSRFISEFADQWLALDKFAVLEPDRGRFPKLTRESRAQLSQEPKQFLQYLIRHDLPVRNLLESDFILANEVTADYYGLAERPDNGFDFLAIPHHRLELGGLLAQAAVQAGLSDGRESNPVKRGAWLARRIVAEPPDDPPPNVPTLKDEAALSLRERLEQHRNQPGCAQCHAKIDPWGVPFEQFDAGGRWKLEEVDASSTLPDGAIVTGFQQLRQYLAEDRLDQVAFSVLKHLSIYAIGRSLTYNELEFLRRDAQRLKENDYRLQDMIQYVVNSPLFLEK